MRSICIFWRFLVPACLNRKTLDYCVCEEGNGLFAYVKKVIFWCLRIASTAWAKRKCATYGAGLKVNYPSAFTTRTFIGCDCHFNGLTVVGIGSVHFGDHFHSGSGILVLSANHNYYSPDALPYDEIDIERPVIIGEAVWVGSRVIILPGTIIGDGAIIQAGAVVSGKVPSCAVVGGNPARIIKYRDMTRFKVLFNSGKFVGWDELEADIAA